MVETEAIVSISNGSLKGRQLKTDDGFDYYSFQGIPYAKPPVGDLRFKAPEPAETWKGTRDASKEGNMCWHINMFLGGIAGDEDCLFINVYTPQLPSAGGKDLPVMVFVHGGGFVMGSGNTDIYGPDYLVQEKVILVTFNYRLGPLGFLSLENENIPGNAGLKDQVAALRWVRQNISAFGGNPENVTIFGESAGGASVHYLLISDSAQGLFHRAISQSGSALNPWAIQKEPTQNALHMCKTLNHPTDDLEEAFKFLQSVPAKDLVVAQQTLSDATKQPDFVMMLVPSIEKELPGQEAFITEDALKRVTEGNFIRVPYITGFNSEEGILLTKDIVNKTVTFDEINADLRQLVPANIPNGKKAEAWDKIKKFYFNDQPVTEETLIKYAHLKGDTEFVLGINKTVLLHSAICEHPVYYYRFAFDEMGIMKMMMQANLPGACHADDLGYLFKVNLINIPVEKDSNIDITRRRMIKLWTNFAKTGKPTPAVDSLIPVLWEPVTKDKLNYLDIDVDLTLRTNPEAARVAFFEELFKDV